MQNGLPQAHSAFAWPVYMRDAWPVCMRDVQVAQPTHVLNAPRLSSRDLGGHCVAML